MFDGARCAQLALLLCAPLASCAQEVAVEPATVRAEVGDFLTEYNAAFAAADTARIRALYVSDDRLTWLEDGTVKYRSVADILASLAALPPGLEVTTNLSGTQIQPLGPHHATVDAQFASTFRGADGGGFSFGGALSMVLELGNDGWRVLSGHTSTARESWDSP